jgi:hypothetical protein
MKKFVIIMCVFVYPSITGIIDFLKSRTYNFNNDQNKEADMIKKGILIGILCLLFVFLSGISLFAANQKTAGNDFTFVQLSDTHWGFSDPKINPDFTGTLKKNG